MPGLPRKSTAKQFNKLLKASGKSKTNKQYGGRATTKKISTYGENMITKFNDFLNENNLPNKILSGFEEDMEGLLTEVEELLDIESDDLITPEEALEKLSEFLNDETIGEDAAELYAKIETLQNEILDVGKSPEIESVSDSNNNIFTIVTFSSGEIVKALYINGTLEFCGDYYHDKIQDKIEGFIEGAKWAGTRIETAKIECTNREMNEKVCDGEISPPKNLQEIK